MAKAEIIVAPYRKVNSWKTIVKLMSFLELPLKMLYCKLSYFWNELLFCAMKSKTNN